MSGATGFEVVTYILCVLLYTEESEQKGGTDKLT